jgi:2-C-methyl-D-erythritol 2,4-cyclodiphosphate synthase
MRAGIGYDIHRFENGRLLILGGVEIPGEIGLAGHSDADLLLHAIIDALLGAAGLGDLGEHFPPDDPQWKDASSLDLLARTLAQVREAGARRWRPTSRPCGNASPRRSASPPAA